MTHELQVEGDKVVERDEQGNVISEKVRPLAHTRASARTNGYARAQDYAHVIRGYKAATHNPRVSSEHKKVRPRAPLARASAPVGPRADYGVACAPQEAAEILHDLEKAHGDAPEASAGASTSPKHHGEGHKGRPHIEKHVAEGGEHEHGHAKAATGSSGPGSSAAHEEEVHRHR